MTFKRVFTGICVFVACACLVGLGVWQLQRLAWKQDLLARIDAQKTLDPSKIDVAAQLDDPDAYLRRGFLTGEYLRGMDVRVGPYMRDGKLGYWIVSPLRLDGQRIVLVNRGWRDGPAVPPPKGRVKIVGTLRSSEKSDRPVAGDIRSWRRLDSAGIARGLGLENVAPLTLFAESAEDGLVPFSAFTTLRNEHKQYAIFWFTMAGILCAGYMWISFRGRR